VGSGPMCRWECVEVRMLFSFFSFLFLYTFFFFGQHFNHSRNRGWGKEGEGGEWLVGEGGGVGDIGIYRRI